jgi:uncharacterized protein (DUF433 family)
MPPIYGELADKNTANERNPAMADTSVSYIVKTPGVCGGKARIDGHRIHVQDVVIWHEEQGQSPEELVTHFPQLTLAKVHAALGYYREHRREHRDEIRRAMQETEAFVGNMKWQRVVDPITSLRKRQN